MKRKCVELDHGSGGEAARELISDVILSRLDNPFLHPMDDSALVEGRPGLMALTTDSYVIQPIFFPGGDIGSLSVHGTVNDLAMQGAEPAYLTFGLILEEGLPLDDLVRILDSAAHAASDAGVAVVTGDTKVVPRGQADGVFINTAGLGWVPGGVDVAAANAVPGDVVMINGSIGDHGIAVLSRREGLDFDTPILSDSAPLNGLVSKLVGSKLALHVLRDPTRGGVAASLNEIARSSGVGVILQEDQLPVKPAVDSGCEMLGLDPLHVANEGKCLVIAPREHAGALLSIMRGDRLGREACIIGEITDENPGRVVVKTRVGGTRILTMPFGEQLPRIC